jgi:hypothetical protein
MEIHMRLFVGISLIIIVGALFSLLLPGCTQTQVDGLINATNQTIDQAITPVADHQGTQGVGPYIRLAAVKLRDLLYMGTDILRIFSPNAGEPAFRPATTQPVSSDQPRVRRIVTYLAAR